MIINNIVFVKRHYYIIVSFGLLYMTHLDIYFSILDKPLYPGLDFTTFRCYITLVGGIIVMSLHFFIGYFFSIKIKLPRITKEDRFKDTTLELSESQLVTNE